MEPTLTVCMGGGLCVFSTPPRGVIPSRMDGVFKANDPGVTPYWGYFTAPMKAHDPRGGWGGHAPALGWRPSTRPSSSLTSALPRELAGVKDGDMRLADGDTANEGRVEIYYSGQWGTVCDNLWDLTDASVVCRALGFKNATEALGRATFGPGNLRVPRSSKAGRAAK